MVIEYLQILILKKIIGLLLKKQHLFELSPSPDDVTCAGAVLYMVEVCLGGK